MKVDCWTRRRRSRDRGSLKTMYQLEIMTACSYDLSSTTMQELWYMVTGRTTTCGSYLMRVLLDGCALISIAAL